MIPRTSDSTVSSSQEARRLALSAMAIGFPVVAIPLLEAPVAALGEASVYGRSPY